MSAATTAGRRARVVTRARFAHDLAVPLGRRIRRPAEHQVLEEVREARLARLDLVARPDLHGDPDAYQIRKSGRDDNHLQTVGQRGFGGRKRENVAGRRARPKGRDRKNSRHHGQNEDE